LLQLRIVMLLRRLLQVLRLIAPESRRHKLLLRGLRVLLQQQLQELLSIPMRLLLWRRLLLYLLKQQLLL
jgi:hypothetical protein